MSELDEVREAEEANYKVSLRLMGDSVTLVQDLLDLYKLLTDISTKSNLAARDEYFSAFTFSLGSRYHLTIGSLAALRGHITDAYRSSRMAIELCAFATRVKQHPHLAMVWLKAGRSEMAYAEYRKKFSGGKLFPGNHALLRELGNRYDSAAKLSHPSVYALAEHTRMKTSETAVSLDFHYFQVKANDASEPPRTFFWIVDTHFGILRVFQQILEQLLAHDRLRWDLQMNAVDAKLAFHKARWKDLILGVQKTL